MAHIPTIYDIPIFIFIALALYTIYKLNKVRSYMMEGALRQSFFWIVVASISFTLWGVVHIIGDFFGTEALEPLLHYGISHGFLLISMLCIAFAAGKIQKAYKALANRREVKKKKRK